MAEFILYGLTVGLPIVFLLLIVRALYVGMEDDIYGDGK